MMARTKKVKLTAYVHPASLALLVMAPTTEELNLALATYAGLLAEAGRRVGDRFSRREWEVLRDALDEACWETPSAGMTWQEVVEFAVDDQRRVEDQIERPNAAKMQEQWGGLLAKIQELDELGAVAIITAVRYCERLGANNPTGGTDWWQPVHRTRQRQADPPAEQEKPAKKPRKRKRA